MKKSLSEFFSLKNGDAPRLLLYLFTFLWFLKVGIVQNNDTPGYWHMMPFRSAGYPIFIKITSLFGLIHSHFPTLLLALVLQIIVINKLVGFLKLHFNLGAFSVFALTAIFVLPDFILSIANADGTECIAYPLFLIVLHLLLKAAFDKDEKAAVSYFGISVLLILVRSQFLFLYAVSLLLIIYLVWFSKSKVKSTLALTGLFVISMVIVPLVDRTYHLVANHSFAPTQFTGLMLVVPALYNMQPKDTLLFTDPVEKGVLDTVLSVYKKNELYNCKFNAGVPADNAVFRFNHLYVLLQFKVTGNYLGNIMVKRGMKPKNMDYWAGIDKITMDIAIKLIKAHPKEYLTLYFYLLKSGMGYMPIIAPFLLGFLLSIAALFIFGNSLSILLFIACLLMILNIGMTSILEMSLWRYLFYTFYLLFAVALMVITKSIEDGNKKKTEVNQ